MDGTATHCLILAFWSVGLQGVAVTDIGSGNGAERANSGGATFTLRPLPIPDPMKIDGLRLVDTASGTTLLYSTQTCRSLHPEAKACQMEIHAVKLSNPTQVAPVAILPRLLPPPPRWDARAAKDGGYEILFEEAGGALYRLLFRDSSDKTISPSRAHVLHSFSRPRFLRAAAAGPAFPASAILDDKSLVVFPDVRANPPAKYVALAEAPEAVVGQSGAPWVVAKTYVGGSAAFDELPGRLSLLRFSKMETGAVTSTTQFPGVLAFELDATAVGADVVVFATGKPAVLLLGSSPARPIALTASNRRWLSSLSRPTVLVSGGRLHLAAIANPAGADAQILYGEIPVAAVHQP